MKQPRNKEAQGRNQREQQARNLPPRVSDPQTGFHLRRLLDIHAPSRTYRIDTIGRELFSAGLLPDHRARYERAISADTEDKERSWDDLGISEGNLEFVEPDIRAKVEIYAGVSLDWAYWDLVDLPAMDTEMRQHLDDILEARRILTRLEKLNVELTGLKISRFLGKKGERAIASLHPDRVSDESTLASLHLRGIRNAAAQFQEFSTGLLYHFPYQGHQSPNRNALPWHFINGMARAYEELTYQRPPKSKSGPFVRFLSAAWQDVGFPTPPDSTGEERADPTDWLGTLVDKHPAIDRKSRAK